MLCIGHVLSGSSHIHRELCTARFNTQKRFKIMAFITYQSDVSHRITNVDNSQRRVPTVISKILCYYTHATDDHQMAKKACCNWLQWRSHAGRCGGYGCSRHRKCRGVMSISVSNTSISAGACQGVAAAIGQRVVAVADDRRRPASARRRL